MVIWSTELHKALIDVGVCATRTVQVSCSFVHLVSCVGNGKCNAAPCLLPNSTLHAPKNFYRKYLHGINSMFAYKWALQLFRIYVYSAKCGTGDDRRMHFDYDGQQILQISIANWLARRKRTVYNIYTQENDRIIVFGAPFIASLHTLDIVCEANNCLCINPSLRNRNHLCPGLVRSAFSLMAFWYFHGCRQSQSLIRNCKKQHVACAVVPTRLLLGGLCVCVLREHLMREFQFHCIYFASLPHKKC